MELYELLFNDVEKVELIVDNIEIKEYDILSKFKRFSLINIRDSNIIVNGISIYLEFFLQNSNLDCNSFQLSFYNISKKIIVSKKNVISQNLNFSLFCGRYKYTLSQFCNDLDILIEKEIDFRNNSYMYYKRWKNVYSNAFKEMNLNLPKEKIENIIGTEENIHLIYNYIKLKFQFYFITLNCLKL